MKQKYNIKSNADQKQKMITNKFPKFLEANVCKCFVMAGVNEKENL